MGSKAQALSTTSNPFLTAPTACIETPYSFQSMDSGCFSMQQIILPFLFSFLNYSFITNKWPKKIILPLLRKLRFFCQIKITKFNICSDKIIWQHPPIPIYPIPDTCQQWVRHMSLCMFFFKNATSKYLKYRTVTWKINFSPKWKRKGAGDNKHAVPNSFNCFLFLK